MKRERVREWRLSYLFIDFLDSAWKHHNVSVP